MNSRAAPFEPSHCPGCGHVPGAGAKFCSECGLPLQNLIAPMSLAIPSLASAVSRRVRTVPLLHRAERRQLTVMFCDIVGSTELSTRIDPEDLKALLSRYRALVEGEVERNGGTTDRFLGDGVMVYFGYPTAREDDAVHAVKAALGIVHGMEALAEQPVHGTRHALQVHIGIHTGMVLIDRTPGGAGDIIGETPNLASKVESLAPPDTVLVSSATHALTAHLFDFAPFGPLQIKGVAPSIDLHRLVGMRDWRRESAIGRGGSKQFFGREAETARLAKLWRCAKGSVPGSAGQGQVAVIVGEPGIGKTRLTQWAAEHAESTGGTVVKYYCAEEAIDTAFWPISETVSRLCRLTGLGAATQLHRLSRAARRAGIPEDVFVPAIADLLSLESAPAPLGPGGKMLTPEGRRQRLVDVLLTWIANLAAETPLLLIVENVHWADPSSLVLLRELAKRAPAMKLLILVTSRPLSSVATGNAVDPQLGDFGHVERFNLERLPSTDLEAMLTALWREAILPGDMQRMLLDKCDGVPLFLEQLVKTVAERASRGGAAALPDVPTSLRDMLAARLDRLGPAKYIALAASVIGRQFPAKLVRALLPRRKDEIESALHVLVAADIISPTGDAGDAVYKFRHALLRDAAYDSLLRSERAKHHKTLAKAYRKHYAALVEAQPELVARHASLAGEIDEALEYWWKAGLRARARSANREATAHFRAGIADAERIEDDEEKRTQVIRFVMATGRAAFAAEGFASPEVERLTNRALGLVEAHGSTETLQIVLGAVFSFYQVRGPLRRAEESAARLLSLMGNDADSAAVARNKRRVGWCAFCRGNVLEGHAVLLDALSSAAIAQKSNEYGLSESDFHVIGLGNLGWVESFAGFEISAVQRCEDAVSLARRRYADRGRYTHDVGNLPGDLSYALCMSAAVAKQRQAPEQVITFAQEAVDFATAHDLPYWRAWATVLLGWGLAHEDFPRGLDLLQQGIDAYQATGARLFVPYNLALLAEAHMAAGNVGPGLACVREALAVADEIDTHFIDSELRRIEARLLALRGDKGSAIEVLDQASGLAEQHGTLTIQRWAERDRRYLLDGVRIGEGLLAAPVIAKTKTRRSAARGAVR